jgi:hypothetical protein
MRTPIRQYHMERLKRLYVREGAISVQMFDATWTMKDIGTWSNVKRSNEIASPIYCLYPSIVRLEAGHEKVVLVKPVIVVGPTLPLPFRGQRATEPRSIDIESQVTAYPRHAHTTSVSLESQNSASLVHVESDIFPEPRTKKSSSPRRRRNGSDTESERGLRSPRRRHTTPTFFVRRKSESWIPSRLRPASPPRRQDSD